MIGAPTHFSLCTQENCFSLLYNGGLCLHFYWNKGAHIAGGALFFPLRRFTILISCLFLPCQQDLEQWLSALFTPAAWHLLVEWQLKNHWSELNDGGMPGRHVSGQTPQETQRKTNLCTVMRLNYSSTEPCAPISLAGPCSHPCNFCTSETLSMPEECSPI